MRILFFILIVTAFVWSDIGYVGALKGSASITRSSGTLDVKNGMPLKVKDTIITSEKSRVQVILNDSTVVTIGSNSTFTFDAYKFGAKDDSEVKMHIERGFFRSVTGKIGKLAPERFKVKTASATIGIRGTDFSALVSEDKETITCYKGRVDVFVNNSSFQVDAGMLMDLAHGNVELKKISNDKSNKNISDQKILTNQLSDISQQEVQSKVDVPLKEPTVEFPDR